MTKKHSVFLYFDEKTSEDPLNLIVTDTANYQTRQVIFSLQKLQAQAGCKGQLISECLFEVLNFPKKQRKNLMNFCPRI